MLETLRSFIEPPVSSEPDQGTAKIAWLIRLRWVAIGAQLLSILPALHFALLERWLLPSFLGVVAVLATWNVVTWLALRRGLMSRQRHVLIQLAADVTALAFLLALTGGAWNPMVPILFVHAGLGSLLLQGRMSLAFFALLILCLLVLQATPYIPPGIQGSMVPRVILFPAQLVVAVVFWILTAWLSRTLTTLQIHSAALSERKTRIDRLRAVGALAAGLSHELATPLNTAKLKLNRMQRRPEAIDPADVDTAREALSRCEDVLRRMAGAQLRPEGVQLDVVDVEDLVEQVCRSFAEANRQAHVRFRAENGHPRFAQLPAVAFSQAMLNLIDNAVQSGGAEQPVDVVVGGRGGRVEVQVLDRGSGWPAVVRQHLGEPFVTTKSGGVGLGLYYVHTLAEAVGAQFSIEDREQGGAVVRISLRAAPALAEGAA